MEDSDTDSCVFENAGPHPVPCLAPRAGLGGQPIGIGPGHSVYSPGSFSNYFGGMMQCMANLAAGQGTAYANQGFRPVPSDWNKFSGKQDPPNRRRAETSEVLEVESPDRPLSDLSESRPVSTNLDLRFAGLTPPKVPPGPQRLSSSKLTLPN